ncbi:C40 family peptidase [Cellulophaga baltica]|uniref:C40 family peptidase n=1 Tax=Cellulophaga TaxID=104264 RepID=UPI001C07E813|nr:MULTISPECIES: C40 family peptidase [Cellulophaga]MBU2995465.1 C40 family peptidase [Cellulophaga baltica]MDO6766859.1 C40 family peptidase [Cellulophaga sp. 1_MG-2023]
MTRKYIYILSSFLIISCGSSKKRKNYRSKNYEKTITVSGDSNKEIDTKLPEIKLEKSRKTDNKASDIINDAIAFSGTKYKYGGTTKKGMDCSGLLYVAFNNNNVSLPRVSYVMAEEGKNINLKNVAEGDLLFFKTSRKSRRINHVGLVVSVKKSEIKFIHATTSRGVIVSSLKEGYWNNAFVKATRVL